MEPAGPHLPRARTWARGEEDDEEDDSDDEDEHHRRFRHFSGGGFGRRRGRERLGASRWMALRECFFLCWWYFPFSFAILVLKKGCPPKLAVNGPPINLRKARSFCWVPPL